MRILRIIALLLVTAIPCNAVTVVQHVPAESSASAVTVAATITANSAGNLIVVAVANNGTRTLSACADNATGGSNTYVLSPLNAHAVNSNRETDFCYVLSAAHAGATTVTVTFSGTAAVFVKDEEVWEVSGFTTVAFDIANNATGTAGTTTLTGAAVVTTGTTGFIGAIENSSNSVTQNPLSGNEFTSGGDIFPTSADGAVSLISSTAASHTPAWLMNATGSVFAASTCAFKETAGGSSSSENRRRKYERIEEE